MREWCSIQSFALVAGLAIAGRATAQEDQSVVLNGINGELLPLPVTVEGGVDVNNAVEVFVPDGVQVTNVVVPVQDEPERPYQQQLVVGLLPPDSFGSVEFDIDEGYYLVVTHWYVEYTAESSLMRPEARLRGSFQGDDFSGLLDFAVVDEIQVQQTINTAEGATTLYADELIFQGARNNSQLGTSFYRVRVTGYLVRDSALRDP